MSAKTVVLTGMIAGFATASLAMGRAMPQMRTASGTQAQQRGPRWGHRPPPPPPSPLLRALDTNRDGVLSAEETAGAPAALKALDENGDGVLTRDELMPPPPDQAAASRPLNGDEGQGHRPPPPPCPMMRVLDADHNGELSAEEIANASKALLTLDENGDGALSREELRPPPPPSPLMVALDTNKDGQLSAEEIANASKALLKLDTNGDGTLTRDELMPPPPPPPAEQ